MEVINKKVEAKDIEINLIEIFRSLLKNLWIIIVATMLAAGIGLIFSTHFITPLYTSTTTVYILNNSNAEISQLSYSDVQTALMLTSDVEELIKSRNVLETTIHELGINRSVSALQSAIQVSSTNDSRIVKIRVTDPEPLTAQTIADKVREVSAEQITSIMGIEAVNLIDSASIPVSPSSPNIEKNTFLGGVIGFFLSVCIIVVLYLVNDRINTSDDVEKYLGISVLGTIPMFKEMQITDKKETQPEKKARKRVRR